MIRLAPPESPGYWMEPSYLSPEFQSSPAWEDLEGDAELLRLIKLPAAIPLISP
ncbi:hypothetical protein NDI45_01565 [Leptolyngbya sp. GB1-A1]|uniref:hypothetical protein n=1 Tax=Leptolyngbya sp. GB1-A1 TaxID=2933908 RepID=UPI0032986F5F